MDVIADLAGHPLTSLLLALAGIVLSIEFYRRDRRSKRLYYRVGDLRDRIWNRNGVVLHLALWNGGSLSLRSTDIAAPVRISSSEGQRVMQARLLCATNPYSKVSVDVRPDLSSAEVGFSYLDPGDGALLQLALDGAAAQEIVARGAVIGGKGPTLRGEPSTTRILATYIPLLLLGWAFVLVGLSSANSVVRIALVILGILFYPLVVGPVYVLTRRREMPPALYREFERAATHA